MAGLFFVHKEIYEIEIDGYSSMFQFRGYDDSTDQYVFYDLNLPKNEWFRHIPSDLIEDVSATIQHKPNLYQFYE